MAGPQPGLCTSWRPGADCRRARTNVTRGGRAMTYATSVVLLLLIMLLGSAFRVIREYQRAVIFMLGRFHKVKRSEEHTSELQSRPHLVCRLLLEKKKKNYHH